MTSALTSGLTFQLASYTANNDLLLATAGDNGTLSFTTPQSASAIYLCGFSGGYAPSEFDVQVNFSDGSSQTFAGNTFDDGGRLLKKDDADLESMRFIRIEKETI